MSWFLFVGIFLYIMHNEDETTKRKKEIAELKKEIKALKDD